MFLDSVDELQECAECGCLVSRLLFVRLPFLDVADAPLEILIKWKIKHLSANKLGDTLLS